MSDQPRAGLTDLINQETGSEEYSDALSDIPFNSPQPVQRQEPVQQQQQSFSPLDLLKRQRDQLMQKLRRNHDEGSKTGVYPDYQLDESPQQPGQKYYGPKSQAAFNADTLSLQDLQYRIQEMQRTVEQDQGAAASARQTANRIANQVLTEGMRTVNKGIRSRVMEIYKFNLQSVPDWGIPAFRDPEYLKAAITMFFNSAHGQALGEHRTSDAGRTGSNDDMDFGEADDEPRPQNEEKNAMGFSESDGLSYQISQGILDRKRKPAPLGGTVGRRDN